MDLGKVLPHPAEANEALDPVAASIRPLPRTVVPSERFLEQMRARLLGLRTARRQPAPRRAA